jgi:hypothetical protein
MNNRRKDSGKPFRCGEKIETSGKSEESCDCLAIHKNGGSTLHSRIREISPQLLRILKRL